MTGMKKMTRLNRLQSDSLAEVTMGFEQSVLDLSSQLRFQGRKLRPGPLLNAIVLWFNEQADEDKARIARIGLTRFEALLADDEPKETQFELTTSTARKDSAGHAVPVKPARRAKTG